MLIPFEQLSLQSRLWVYASKKEFTEEQKAIISNELESFIATWEAHGDSLKGSYKIEYGHFIVLAVDEAHHGASGCSIDKSVQVIRTIESKASLDLMDRLVAYVLKNQHVEVFPVSGIKAAIDQGQLSQGDDVFDHSISTIQEYTNGWIKQAGNTWLARYFTSVLK